MPEGSNVIAAVDFHRSTDQVVSHARRMAGALGGRLVLVHAVLDLEDFFGFYQGPKPVSTLQRELEDEARRHMDELVRSSQASEGRVAVGFPPDVIRQACRAENAGLLVMGAHNESTPEAVVFGGTADKILRRPPCPILLVPANSAPPAGD